MPSKPYPLQNRAVPWAWLTRAAFLLTIALVIARMMMLETLRTSGSPVPGIEAAPLGPGPATGLALDLLCVWPALMVLARRALDRRFTLRFSWAAIFLILLGLWSVASTLWAADRFTALVSSLHWCSAMVLLWSTMQLVDSWLRLRVVGGACVGMLLALTVAGYYFRLVEWHDLKAAWDTNRADILREHDWAPDSFAARQFEKRILAGQVMGFSASPNTYAAILVLLGTVAVGVAMQRAHDGEGAGWIIIPVIVIVAALPDLIWAASRGAAATAIMAAVLLWVTSICRVALRKRSRTIYWRTLAALVLIAAAIVGHGLYHHTLFHDSLTFRWRYWVGAARLIAAHPLLGTGWENFGLRYLAYRLPIASEEIRDPHNFIVRVVAELGSIGGVLLIAGMLRLAWEITQGSAAFDQICPVDPDFSARTERRLAAQRIAAVATLAVVFNFIAAVDLNSSSSFILLEAMRRVLDSLLLIVGLATVTFRPPAPMERQLREGELEFLSDQRPAPWLLYAAAIGLGMFLVHNLIDFAMFEFGPMFLFALIAGAALGARGIGTQPAKSSRVTAGAMLGLGTVAWIVLAGWVVLPIIAAESLANDADNAIRQSKFDVAAGDLDSALVRVPYNADYAFRLSQLAASQGEPALAIHPLDQAIAANPASTDYLALRAELDVRSEPPQISQAIDDFTRALALDPNNVALHRRFADVLAGFGDRAGARREYELALQKNDGLDPQDPKRLSQVDVAAVKKSAELGIPGTE